MELQQVIFRRWWESYIFLPVNVSHPPILIDSPELAPGTLLGPSGATVSVTGSGSHGTSTSSGDSSTGVPTPTPTKKSSNTGAIVGGVVGGVAAISIGAFGVVFFLLRRKRSQAPTAAPGFGASQPPMDEIQRPLTDEGMYTASSLPGTVSSPPGTMSSLPGTPIVPMRLYVSVSCPITRRASVCSSHVLSFFFQLRTRMTQPRSLGTKEFRNHRPPLLKVPYRLTVEPETPWPPCRPRGHRGHRGDIMACLPSNSASRSHRSHRRSPVWVVLLFLLKSSFNAVAVAGQCWLSLLVGFVPRPRTGQLKSLCYVTYRTHFLMLTSLTLGHSLIAVTQAMHLSIV